MRKLILPALLIAGSATFSGQSITLDDSISGPSAAPKPGISMDLTAIDKTVDPCADFYQYACGNWRKNNPIPADKTRWGRFDELGENNTYNLWKLVSTAASSPKTPLQKKYGDYYAACMNVDLANKLGTKPIDPYLDAIDGFTDKGTFASSLGMYEDRTGGAILFGFGSDQDQKDSTKQIGSLSQGGLTLPDRDYYLQNDPRTTKLRNAYIEHVKKMFVLLGDTPEKAATEAANVLKIETALAQGATPRVELRDPSNTYHIMTRAELKTLTPHFNWDDYFTEIHVTKLPTLNVATPNYFKTLDTEIANEPVDVWKSYFRWHVLHGAAGSLSKQFDEENFAFFGKIMSGQQEQTPRWKRCTAATDRALGEAVGQDYVQQYFPPAAKKNMKEMVTALETAMHADIQKLDWMSEPTRAQAEVKLAAFRDKIGYPEKWRDYTTLDVDRDDPVGNSERVGAFRDRRDIGKIGQPVDEKEWGMTPPTVNAYYNPAMNDINFPAGILQPPFYDFKIDPAVNYGAIGVVIGHEMTHGFDDEGSQYDATGNVRQWWTPEDRKKFDERTQCEVDEYGSFEAAPGAKLNGKLTLGENTADNGGLRISYDALHTQLAKTPGAASKKVDGYSVDQRYFLGYAQVWCQNVREETARLRAKTDPHSPGEFRVNGAVQNFEKFGEAFGCKKGQPMMPVKYCRVW